MIFRIILAYFMILGGIVQPELLHIEAFEDRFYLEESELNNSTIPLKRAGNLILVDGTVDGMAGTFILDTGAPGLVLNSTYFRDGKPVFGGVGAGITGQNIQRKTKRIDLFEFGGFRYENLQADVINLGHIENSKKVKVLGLIGTSLMQEFELVIDLQNMTLKMAKTDRSGELIQGFDDHVNYTLHEKAFLYKDVIITHLPVAGKKMCFCLDTGAENNVLHNRSHRKVLETISITGRSVMKGASSQRLEVFHGTMNDFSFSGHDFSGMKVAVLNLSNMRKGFGIEIDGMLGFDFFNLGIIRLNLQKKEISIAPYED